jgi:hypothetical protein
MDTSAQGRTLAVRIVAIVTVCLAGWALMGVYAVGPSFAAYVAPTRAFLRAAVAGDTAALARAGADPAAVRWALVAGRRDTVALRELDRGLALGSGKRKADSTVVWFNARGRGRCAYWSLTMVYVGNAASRRIDEARVYCSATVTTPSGLIVASGAGPT